METGKTGRPNSQTGRYLKYAFGEIVLVVIGILIALQINNWNENRKNNGIAENFMAKLKVQLELNIKKTDDEIAILKNRLNRSQNLALSLIGTQEPINDIMLDSLIYFNWNSFNLNLDLNLLIEGRENGTIALLPSDSLRQAIYEINTFYEYIKDREEIGTSHTLDQFEPYLTKHYNYRNHEYNITGNKKMKTSKLYKNDNYKMLSDQEFENLLSNRIYYNEEMISQYLDLKAVLKNAYNLL
jgi:hypothetical protein